MSKTKIDALTKLAPHQLVTQLIVNAPNPKISGLSLKNKEINTYGDFLTLLKAELTRLTSSKSGLGDRMLWFWHGLITSAYDKVSLPALLWRQHQLIAKHALGNFRQLLIDISTDVTMLGYLDGTGSTIDHPNENYARELMELFTMGPGNYTQADVTAAAKILSGWYVTGVYNDKIDGYNPSKVRANYAPSHGLKEPVEFLGQTALYDIPMMIDRILQHPNTAAFVVTQIFKHFVHMYPSEAVINELASVFRNANYEIRPLLVAMFQHDEFVSNPAAIGRPKLPMEWLLSSITSVGLSLKSIDYKNFLDSAGQLPFNPATVAGWRIGHHWLNAATATARNMIAIECLNLGKTHQAVKLIARSSTPVDTVIQLLSLPYVSEQTRQQLMLITQSLPERYAQSRALIACTLISPEFALT